MFHPIVDFSGLQWLLLPVIVFGRYAFICLILFTLFYGWKRRDWLWRKIQPRFPQQQDYWREVSFSALTSVIFGAVIWLCLGTGFREYTQFYRDIHEHSIAWLVLSVPLTLLLHDAYFYWIHRLMHHPKLYRQVHLVHHKSVNPSPWAAYAFHPIEAVLEAGIVPILLMIMPLHPISFFAFVTLMLWFNVYGHLGYELFSPKMYTHWLGRWVNSSVHHNLHHEKFHGNYGLYTTIWDRLCGTLREDSIAKVAEVQGRNPGLSPTGEGSHDLRRDGLSRLPSPTGEGPGVGLTRAIKFLHTTHIMHKPLLLLLTLLLSALAAQAQAPVNWASDVAPILYDHCVKCHRDGGLGHFSLIGYSNAVTNRFAIQEATASKRMPPWKPDPAYRRYAHENRLTDAQIATIKSWVEADAPSGDLAQAPPEPVFTSGSEVGTPDLMLQTPLYTVTATDDEYRCFVIPTGLSQAAYLRGLEALPGNHEVVHHILVYEDTTGQGRAKDLQTPEPGYVNFGSSGVAGARLVGAWAPGAQITLVPPFMGIKLRPGSDLIVQMHYPKGSAGKTDQSTLNLFFTPTNQGIREIRLTPILNHTPLSLENGPLSIPPDTKKTYHAKFTMPQATSMIIAAPHMHLIGRNIVSFAVTLQGDTIPLIRINDWDFHWQGGYFFQKVQKIPAFSTLHAYAEYDNTADNPHQPSSPPLPVEQGESTTDEMLLVFFAFMAYQPGDENILLDSTLLSSGVRPTPLPIGLAALKIYPNPARDVTALEYELSETTDLRTTIFDVNGHVVRVFAEKRDLAPGLYCETLPVADLPPGVYFARIQTGKGSAAIKFLVEH